MDSKFSSCISRKKEHYVWVSAPDRCPIMVASDSNLDGKIKYVPVPKPHFKKVRISNVEAECLTLLFCIPEIPGSNLSPETVC